MSFCVFYYTSLGGCVLLEIFLKEFLWVFVFKFLKKINQFRGLNWNENKLRGPNWMVNT